VPLFEAGDPGNAILLNGVVRACNLEIGVPGFQPSQLIPLPPGSEPVRGNFFMDTNGMPM
jgi:hypothetical protein